jgi:molybdopterin-guanine dinucleotide biosynthesis protein A
MPFISASDRKEKTLDYIFSEESALGECMKTATYNGMFECNWDMPFYEEEIVESIKQRLVNLGYQVYLKRNEPSLTLQILWR